MRNLSIMNKKDSTNYKARRRNSLNEQETSDNNEIKVKYKTQRFFEELKRNLKASRFIAFDY